MNKCFSHLSWNKVRILKYATFFACSGTMGSYYYYSQHSQVELSQDYFTKYRISYKEYVDKDHFLLELTPLKQQKNSLWNLLGSHNLWSVEIKQPEMMVVRNYTPLPLQVNQTTNKFEMFKDSCNSGGKLFFYIKRYETGEVSKWLSRLPKGHVVELRGPYIDYQLPKPEESKSSCKLSLDEQVETFEKFKHQPSELVMFLAGTGIVTALQFLLAEKGFSFKIKLFYSCSLLQSLGPLLDFLNLFEEEHRLELNLFESGKGNSFKNDTSKFFKCVLDSFPYLENPVSTSDQRHVRPVMGLVCGPESYIASVAGAKYDLSQGQIKVILEDKGLNNSNLYRLSLMNSTK